MTRKQATLLFKGLIAMAGGLAIAAHVQAAACRVTQTTTVAGQQIESDLCMQNLGLDAARFKALCADGSEGVPSLGVAPAKVVYLAACPTKAVNVCEGFG